MPKKKAQKKSPHSAGKPGQFKMGTPEYAAHMRRKALERGNRRGPRGQTYTVYTRSGSQRSSKKGTAGRGLRKR